MAPLAQPLAHPMKTWHYQRIQFRPCEPRQAPAGNWVFFYLVVLNSDPKSPFRRTEYAMETLGL